MSTARHSIVVLVCSSLATACGSPLVEQDGSVRGTGGFETSGGPDGGRGGPGGGAGTRGAAPGGQAGSSLGAGGQPTRGAGGARGGTGGGASGGTAGGGTGGGAATGGAAGSAATGGGGGGNVMAAHCGAARTLVESADTLIDLFVVDAGVIVVDASGVTLVGRDAKVIKAVPFARQITAAAFDGTRLVVADEAELTVMSPALDVGPTAFLTMSCVSAVLVGENHFVCGPATDWDRVFYTYDVGLNPPVQVATSAGSYTYLGSTMWHVPGTDSFVTVESQFSLFGVDAATGMTSLEAQESPFDSGEASGVFAFDGTPAAHLIQDEGYIVGITGTGCQSASGPCFVQTGMLGTLRTGQDYIGLGDDGAGRIVAVVSPVAGSAPFGSPCVDGCPVQYIDVASRTILQQQTYAISDLGAIVRTAYDRGCGSAVVGYWKMDPNSGLGLSGYRVEAFAF
jgi:hypothetical protein